MAEQAEQSFDSFSDFTNGDPPTEEAVRAYISGKAQADAAFRESLLADPLGTVSTEVGMTLPNSLRLNIHEETNDELHLVLPAGDELRAGDLDAVAGGWQLNPPKNNDGANLAADHND